METVATMYFKKDIGHYELPAYDKLILRADGPDSVPPPDENDQRGVYWCFRFLGNSHQAAVVAAHTILCIAVAGGMLPKSLVEDSAHN